MCCAIEASFVASTRYFLQQMSLYKLLVVTGKRKKNVLGMITVKQSVVMCSGRKTYHKGSSRTTPSTPQKKKKEKKKRKTDSSFRKYDHSFHTNQIVMHYLKILAHSAKHDPAIVIWEMHRIIHNH